MEAFETIFIFLCNVNLNVKEVYHSCVDKIITLQLLQSKYFNCKQMLCLLYNINCNFICIGFVYDAFVLSENNNTCNRQVRMIFLGMNVFVIQHCINICYAHVINVNLIS